MKERVRWERALRGESVDRPPVTLWQHRPGDEDRGTALAAAALHFQHLYHWDALILPARAPGTMEVEEAVRAVSLVRRGIGPALPLIQVLHGPRTHDDAPSRRDFPRAVEAIRHRVEALFRAGIDGILYVLEGVDEASLWEAHREILDAAHARGYVLLHVHGPLRDPAWVETLPVHAVGWHGAPDGGEGLTLPRMGGISPQRLATASPAEIVQTIQQAMRRYGRSLIVTASCAVPVDVPAVNLRALRAAVEL